MVCLTSNEANVVRSKLRFKHEIHDIIDLQVNSIDCLQEELCDMVILSTIAEDNREVKLVQDNNINAALTISRFAPTINLCCDFFFLLLLNHI